MPKAFENAKDNVPGICYRENTTAQQIRKLSIEWQQRKRLQYLEIKYGRPLGSRLAHSGSTMRISKVHEVAIMVVIVDVLIRG